MENISAIFTAQSALKTEIEGAIELFKVDYPEVKQVSVTQEYTGEGEVIRLVVNVESEGESITRKV